MLCEMFLSREQRKKWEGCIMVWFYYDNVSLFLLQASWQGWSSSISHPLTGICVLLQQIVKKKIVTSQLMCFVDDWDRIMAHKNEHIALCLFACQICWNILLCNTFLVYLNGDKVVYFVLFCSVYWRVLLRRFHS